VTSVTDPNRTGRHRRPTNDDSDETDAERTQRHPAVQRVVDEFLVDWPQTDLDRP
jgi:hypothetical protein